MALNYSGLSKYIDQLNKDLIVEAVTKARTFKYVGMRVGIKNSQMLNIMKGGETLQAGNCVSAASAAGNFALTQRELHVAPIVDVDTICINTFEEYWMGQFAKQGSYNESLPDFFQREFVAKKNANLQREIERIFWQGDTTGSGNLAFADGMLKLLNAATGTVKVGAGTGHQY